MKNYLSIILLVFLISVSYFYKTDSVKATIFLQTASSSSGSVESSTSSSSGNTSSGSTNTSSSSSSGFATAGSSSSSGSVQSNSSSSSSGLIALNKNFSGIWQGTKSPQKPECIICAQVLPKCDLDEILIPQSCTECAHCEASDSEEPVRLNNQIKLSKINLMLCVNDGILQGVINQAGSIKNATITTQNIINKNEVSITFEEDGITRNATLQLINNKSLLVNFPDKQTFKTRKVKIVNCNQNTNPCKRLSNEIKKLIEDTNFCAVDTDCVAVQNQVCPFGCYNLSNKNATRNIIIEKIADYIIQCETCSYKCSTPPSDSSLKCVNSKCVENK